MAVDDPRVAHVADAATAVLAALREHDHWGFKDPRTCLTAAYWLDLEPELRFVICVRHPLEVALSLKRRNQNSYSLGLALWERYYATALDHVPVERRIVTHYDTFFLDPEGEMARLCAFAGLQPAAPRVRNDLRHHTTDIDLADAGVGDSVRSLYAALCREAGAPPPREATNDEGRVRRQILDGAVAQRHADQRQAAIDRLQEREEEFRAAHAKAEQAYRDKIRDLEAGVAAAQRAALETETVATLRAVRESMARIDERTRRAESRSLVGTVGRAARAAARQLPPPAQQALRRGRRLARRAAAEPRATARIVKQRAVREVRAQATQLPLPAQRAARGGRALYRRGTIAPGPTARAVVRRLPDPAQRLARRTWATTARLRHGAARRISDPAPKPASTPKGPAPRLWRDAYRHMVTTAWSEAAPWLVTIPGSPAEVRTARVPRGTPFPDVRRGRPFADDLSHIAHLEAQRYTGHKHLVVPEGSRPWFRQRAELRDHLVSTYFSAVDEPGAGTVFDLGCPAAPGTDSLAAVVDELAAGLDHAPAVLDCTGLGLGAELPDLAVFSPPAEGPLPYLDRSVDVVVVSPGGDLVEAHRVAACGVITAVAGASGPVVHTVDGVTASGRPAAPAVVVWSGPGPDPRWQSALAERVEQAGARLVVSPIATEGIERVADHDVVVALEPHVIPLPGAIRAAAAAAVADPGSAVAGKVLRGDGRLESAGATVFFDRSVGLIAASSPDVRGPWHDYVRPVCWAPGLVAAAAGLWTGVEAPPGTEGRPFVREWCAAVWGHGGAVVYHPDITAVRVDGDGGEPSIPLETSTWQRVLDLRPARPPQLSDGAWRYLLARDDVEACRA
jgi:hypothetical protein